jgi:Leucine-rich repeat (LRR) protein
MSCVLNLVIFAILWHKVWLIPVVNLTSTEGKTKNVSDHIVEMGRGIQEIPLGNTETKILNLGYNQIISLPEFVFHNKSYKSLTKIELHQNRICTIHLTAFRGLRQLASVILSDNNITSLDPYIFKHNPRLEKIDFSRNKISFNRLRVFLVSQTLESLIVSQNRIEQIYELTFIGVPNLKNLILDGNILSIIAPNSFKSLNKLQYLSLTNTGVYRLSESMFNNNLPRIIDLQETPLAKRFDPPLKKITNNAVRNLINMDQYIFLGDTTV